MRRNLDAQTPRIARLVSRGATLAEISAAIGYSPSAVHGLVRRRRMPLRKREIPPAAARKLHRLLRAATLTYAEIARQVGCHRSTVSRRAARAVLAFADRGQRLRPRQVAPYRCPGCERTVRLRPCPACVARGSIT